MEAALQAFFSAFVLAVLIEGVITYFVSNPEKPQPWLKYLSAALGVGATVAYKSDLLAAFGLVSIYPFVGQVFTGLVVGRGSNFLNDFISKIRTKSPSSVTATVPAGSSASAEVRVTADITPDAPKPVEPIA